MEWLWRSLTYGKLQPLAPERSRSSRVGSIVTYNADQAGTSDAPRRSPPEGWAISGWLVFVLRRLLFIAVVAFAIVYFCALGLRLSVNSTSAGRRLGAWEVAGPALEDTIDFFKDGLRGDLGYTVRGI